MATAIHTEDAPAVEVPAEDRPVDGAQLAAEDAPAEEPVVRPAAKPPGGPGNPETLIAGEQGPEVSEEERQRRAAILATQLREIDEEDKQRAEEERRKKAEESPQGPQKERSRIGNIYARWGLGLNTYDNYFSVAAAIGGNGSAPTPQMSNAQLKALILTAAFEKNWHTLYLYKDRSTIDPNLTARAQQMIIELQREGQPLHGYHMRVSPIRLREVEPWNQGRPLYAMWREASNYKNDTILGIKESVRSTWNNGVVSMMFTSKAAADPVSAAAATPGADNTADRPAATPDPSGTTIADAAAEAVTRRANPGAGLGAGR